MQRFLERGNQLAALNLPPYSSHFFRSLLGIMFVSADNYNFQFQLNHQLHCKMANRQLILEQISAEST